MTKNPKQPTFKLPGSNQELNLAEALGKLGIGRSAEIHDIVQGERQHRKQDIEYAKKCGYNIDKPSAKYKKFISSRKRDRAKRYLRRLGAPESMVKKITKYMHNASIGFMDILEDMALGLSSQEDNDINKPLKKDVVMDIHAEKLIDKLQSNPPKTERLGPTVEKAVKKAKKEVILTGNEDYRNIHMVRDPVLKLAMFKALANDIVFFVRKVLKAEPTPQQIQLLTEFQKEGCRISVRSAHGTGKSCSLAWIILHSLLFIPNVRILCTAPSAPQMHDVLWAELKFWKSQMGSYWWEKQIRITQKRAEFVASERSISGERVINNANRFATARTARKDNPVALQGMHAENMIVLVDEASGVPNEVYEVGEGTLTTEGARVVMMSNPTTSDPENYFFRSHNKHREFWTCLHFSALDSPLVDEAWIEEEKLKYGEDSPIYQFRVLGEFPKISDDILIPLHFVESAWGRDVQSAGERICGVDPARFGADQTGVVIRQGNKILHIEKWAKYDTMYTAARVADMYNEGLFDVACVDTIGIGAGVADRLKQLIGAQNVIEVNVAERPAAREQFNRLRDELWWKTREFFEKLTASFDTDKIEKYMFDEIVGELCSIKYSYQGNGKRKVQSKDDLKKDGRKSPNIADALCLTFIKDVGGETAHSTNFPGIARKISAPAMNGAILG